MAELSFGEFLLSLLSLTFLAQVLRITVPYALAALGGVVSERSGVINIALEGKLLSGAFAATIGAYYSGSIAVGALCGILGGVAVAALYALVVVRFKADQIVAGVAINMMAYGLTRYLLRIPFDSTASSAQTVGFGGEVIANPLFWFVCVLIGLVYLVYARTAFGLRLRAVGEHPEAADTLGVSVDGVRWSAVLIAGGLAGLGGAWMSLSIGSFAAEMSAGRGYIALAAVIMGRWRPLAAVFACLLFGFADALQLQLQNRDVGLPSELIEVLPYLLAMIALAGFMGRSRPPAALGKPYSAE